MVFLPHKCLDDPRGDQASPCCTLTELDLSWNSLGPGLGRHADKLLHIVVKQGGEYRKKFEVW